MTTFTQTCSASSPTAAAKAAQGLKSVGAGTAAAAARATLVGALRKAISAVPSPSIKKVLPILSTAVSSAVAGIVQGSGRTLVLLAATTTAGAAVKLAAAVRVCSSAVAATTSRIARVAKLAASAVAGVSLRLKLLTLIGVSVAGAMLAKAPSLFRLSVVFSLGYGAKVVSTTKLASSSVVAIKTLAISRIWAAVTTSVGSLARQKLAQLALTAATGASAVIAKSFAITRITSVAALAVCRRTIARTLSLAVSATTAISRTAAVRAVQLATATSLAVAAMTKTPGLVRAGVVTTTVIEFFKVVRGSLVATPRYVGKLAARLWTNLM